MEMYNQGRYFWYNLSLAGKIFAIIISVIWAILPALVGILLYIYFNNISDLWLIALCPLTIASAAWFHWLMKNAIKF